MAKTRPRGRRRGEANQSRGPRRRKRQPQPYKNNNYSANGRRGRGREAAGHGRRHWMGPGEPMSGIDGTQQPTWTQGKQQSSTRAKPAYPVNHNPSTQYWHSPKHPPSKTSGPQSTDATRGSSLGHPHTCRNLKRATKAIEEMDWQPEAETKVLHSETGRASVLFYLSKMAADMQERLVGTFQDWLAPYFEALLSVSQPNQPTTVFQSQSPPAIVFGPGVAGGDFVAARTMGTNGANS